MTAQQYIETELGKLKKPLALEQSQDSREMIDVIFQLLTSKKFRRYALTADYADHIKNSIKLAVENNQPLNIVFLGGAYKLWRLAEAPEADWAELFAYMHYSKWLGPVCAIYNPGVNAKFFMDDFIVPRMNNIPRSDVQTNIASRQQVLSFLKQYQLNNLNMELLSVGEQFGSRQDYEKALAHHIKKLTESLPDGLPVLTLAQRASTELNVKPTLEQQKDPKWREKVELLHSAYMNARTELTYWKAPENIRALCRLSPSKTNIAVGTTKDSIVNFWTGAGALLPRDGSFRQLVLSIKQLKSANFDWKTININGLNGKNFHKIRILR